MNNHNKFILLMVVLFNLILPLNVFAEETTLEQGQATVKEMVTSGNREFFTIVTTNGTTYYLVVDYDSNNRNVYFLKSVDEIDLIDLAGINPIIYNQEEQIVEEPAVEEIEDISENSLENTQEKQEVTVSEKKSIDTFTLVGIIGLVALGIFIIFSKIKGNKKVEIFDDEDDYIEENEDIQENNNSDEDFLQSLKNKKDREDEE